MNGVQIKGVNDHLLFMMNDEVSDEDCLNDLEKLLCSPSFQKNDFHVKGYFDYGKKPLTKERFEKLMGVLKRTKVVLFCGLDDKLEEKKVLGYQNGIIRNGEVLFFEEDLLFEGKINPGGRLVVCGHLYMIGNCQGTIQVVGKNATIHASDLKHAVVQLNENRIEDISIDGLTTFYEEQSRIKCSRGDEGLWQEQLWSHLEKAV